MQISKIKNKGGFSLIEVLVAMFISTLIIISITAAFASAFKAQKKAREIQKSIEESKVAMEYMAKIIRMSGNIKSVSGGDGVSMYNKSTEKCVVFTYDAGNIEEEKCTPSSEDDPCSNGTSGDCTGSSYGSPNAITSNGILDNVKFNVSSGSGTAIDTVTIFMKIKSTIDSNGNFQTTISARDYKNLNPIED